MRSRKRKKRIKKRYIFLAILLGFIGGVGYYIYDLNKSLTNTMDQIYEELDRGEQSEKRAEPIDEDDPISIALFGVDERPGDSGRSDTIIIATLNPQEESMYLFNIPRDTLTTIVGKGTEDKISHAYSFGGINMAVNTIENFLDIPIDYYAQVNMDGFTAIVDIFGGVNVNVERGFSYEGNTFHEGEMVLDGEAALAYSRMRKEDPRGDAGRNDRQQQVLTSLIDEATSYKTITKIDEIFEAIALHAKTNIQREDIDDFRKNYLGATKERLSLTIEGVDQRLGPQQIWYYIVEETEQQRVSNLLKEHLQINQSSP